MATSELMELYNYKISYLAQAERVALASVEASTKLSAHLQHRISRLTHEHHKLQQSEFYTIQKCEEVSRRKEALSLELKDLQNRLNVEEAKYKTLHSRYLQAEKDLAALKGTEEKLAKVQQLFNKVQETCIRHEKNEQKMEEMLKNAKETIKDYTARVNKLEKDISEKEKELEETKADLQLKTAILDNITKMANSGKLNQ